MSEASRNLISRGALLLLAIALSYAGYRVTAQAFELRADYLQRNGRVSYYDSRHRDSSGALVVGSVGVALAGAGLFCAAAAVLPEGWTQRLMHPRAPRTRDNPETPIPPSYF